MAAETAPPEPPPQKFSRYRSVRRAQAQQAQLQTPVESQQITVPPMPPLPAMEAQNDAPVSRSMSRYHRRPTTSHAAAARPPLRSATVDVPQAVPAQTSAPPRYRALSSPQAHVANHVQSRMPNTSRARAEPLPLAPAGDRQHLRTPRDEARQLIQDEAERQRRMKEKLEAEKRAKAKAEQAEQAERERERQEQQRKEEEAERLRVQQEAEAAEQLRRQKEEKERGKRLQKAESARRIQEREEAERRARIEEATRKAQASPPVSPPRQGGGFGIFKWKRDGAPTSPEGSSNSSPPPHTGYEREMDTIRPGGGGAVLGIDAPMSAVNAGDRRVTVVRNDKAFVLPVTPDTTAQDLLKSAALCMTEPINVNSDILLESFRKVGVQRPLRIYEHVRDVLNSWDNDTQNDLEIVSAAYHQIKYDALVASQVPSSKPGGMGCYINYSSKPGKWYKKYVTLRSDGQLVMAKNETSKDVENICHLSDFDIYTPTDRKMSKIKPPKKECYAIKSQQKSNIFSDETRYVHFFCTNDHKTAKLFYEAVQGWRSWHLIHVMGEGQKVKKKATEAKGANSFLQNGKSFGSSEQNGASLHTRNASTSSYYQLGSFKPLFDLDQLNKDLDNAVSSHNESPSARMDSKMMHSRKMSVRVRNPPPVAFNRSGLIDQMPVQTPEGSSSFEQGSSNPSQEGFLSSGLLGDVYAQRQKALQEREKKESSPFTEGSSLLNSMGPMGQPTSNDGGLNRRSSVRSHHRRTSSDIQRSTSMRVKPKPLVDLTPQYCEPPQHRNKGKGFAPEAGSGPLIENATSIEEAIKIPPSTDWRSRPMTARTHGTYGTGGHERTRSLKNRGEGLAAYTVNNHNGAPTDDSHGFTGGGLLARAGFRQGNNPGGHGFMDGSKARGPMLDMRDNSQFASGSLLASVEERQGVRQPVVDRDRRQSVDLR